jgi:hypothetical protein
MVLAVTLAISSTGCTAPSNGASLSGGLPSPPADFQGQTDGTSTPLGAAGAGDAAAKEKDETGGALSEAERNLGLFSQGGLLTPPDDGTRLRDFTPPIRPGHDEETAAANRARLLAARREEAAPPPPSGPSLEELWDRYLAAQEATNQAFAAWRADITNDDLKAAYEAAEQRQREAFDTHGAAVDARLAN